MSLPLKPLGGGGYNSLKEKENDDNPQSDDDTGDSGESEVTTYTYKSYLDYFIDNMDCTGVYDTDGNLTNVTISAEKKAEILSYDFTGNGTANDPYQINTTQGFWYMSKFVDLTSKYVELNCDVILNDENFDENGNASGGDGVVYDWESMAAHNLRINGNEHTIYGLYKNNESLSAFAMIKSNVQNLENLKCANVFISVQEYATCISYDANIVNNVDILSGTIKAVKFAFGVCRNANYVYDCSNYADILVTVSNAAGILSVSNKLIQNCNNFGDVTLQKEARTDSKWVSIGGVCSNAYTKIIDCNNYGTITNVNGGIISGGVVSIVYGLIENCDNYGNICLENCGGYNGAICGFSSSLTIDGCNNYGNIKTTVLAGGIFGQADGGTKITIKNCNNFGSTYATCMPVGIAGHLAGLFNIENCGVYGKLEGSAPYLGLGLIIGYTPGNKTNHVKKLQDRL